MGYDFASRYFNEAEERPDLGIAAAARVASGVGAAFDTEDIISLLATLTTTLPAAPGGGGETYTARLETSLDGAAWYTVGSFPAVTEDGVVGRVFVGLGAQARWAWTIAGAAPSFTFKIDVLANRDD